MYHCGYGSIASVLLGADHTEAGASLLDAGPDGVPFALPGDRPQYAPDRPADVRHVDIDVVLDFTRHSVQGRVTTAFTALFEEVQQVTLDAAELAIERVTMGPEGAAAEFWQQGEQLHIRLDRTYRFGEEFRVTVRYSAEPRTGLVFVAPVEGNRDLPEQAWTQGETEYHHFWFPCHDSPNDRATTALRATVPASFFALSNGTLEAMHENADGTRTYAWRQEVPHPVYLTTLVAGEFSELPATWRGKPITAYVRPGREDDGRRMFANTGRMLDFFSERFGLEYPYTKYAQIVPELFLGAMENISATTHSYRLLPDARASLDWSPDPVIAHEMAHQWHGDLMTPRDWAHTWLKEGFADFFEAAWIEHDLGTDEFRTEMRGYHQNYLAADARGRRPIVCNTYRKNGQEIFDATTYQKGASVLHVLRNVVGDAPFWRGVQSYTRRNAGREVITADFERAMEEATGRTLARFFEQWVYKAGHPEFKVSYTWDDEQKLARLGVKQTQKLSETTPIFATPVDLGFFIPESDAADATATLTVVRVQVEEADQTFYLPLPRRPRSVRFDQGGWLIKTLDFERPSELLRYQLAHDPDVLGRIEAAEALGKLGDRQSFEALEQALLEEPFWSAKSAIARALGNQHSERALNALLRGLEQIDAPKARRGIVAALGSFRMPEHGALAQRAAAKLAELATTGEPSYFVEAAAAAALGKTRTPAAFEQLLPLLERPSWNETIRGGVFAGLGELGEPRVVEVLAGWLLDRSRPMDARAAAAAGLRVLADTKRIEGEAKTRAVDALLAALSDPWEPVQRAAIAALAAFGDARAIAALQDLVVRHPDEHVVRGARTAVLRLQSGSDAGQATRTLREDMDAVREENRKLRERLEVLEARLPESRAER